MMEEDSTGEEDYYEDNHLDEMAHLVSEEASTNQDD